VSEEVVVEDGLTRFPFVPDYAEAPGATLRETLEHLGMSQAEFARRADLSTTHVNQIIQGEAPITVDTARRLELVTEVPADTWSGLEASFQAAKMRLAIGTDMTDEDRVWVHDMPVSALIDRGFIPDTRDTAARFDGLLRFFGVANRHGWEALWAAPDASFHRSMAYAQKPHQTSTWLRLAELKGAEVETAAFDRGAFKEAAREVRDWVREPITKDLISRIRGRLAATGVAFVIVRDIQGTRASGATRWLSPDKALIALSLRYRRDDRFWFTFFHEVAHVLLHGKRITFIEEERTKQPETGGEEAEADRFASDVLIPRQMEIGLRGLATDGDIETFAQELQVPPGVVVGRMQRLKVIDWQTPFNALRKEIDADELQSAADEVLTAR
jgi:HTH-type transcriptional regulator/antitoxin HigA